MSETFYQIWKRGLLVLIAGLLFIMPAYSQSSECGLRVSLLTASPGEELYSTFGHSALRVIDTTRQLDIVFNYGTFNFDEPGFYMKFVRGKLEYFVSADPYESFVYGLKMENRSITEQVLDLNCKEKEKLIAYLDWNMLPANRFYKYDFTFDNCTTRLRDLIDSISMNQVSYHLVLAGPMTFRGAIHEYLNRNNKSWSKLGIDILLGSRLDRTMTNRETTFLPDFLMQSFDSAQIDHHPLVKDKELVLKRTFVPLESDNITNPLFLFSCLFVIIAFLSFSNNRVIEKILLSLDGVLFFLNGLIGILLIFMWAGTDHFMTKDNYNLLWAWPVNIIMAFYVHGKLAWQRIYLLVFGLAQLLLLGVWFILPQQMNPALIPVIAILIFRALLTFITNRKRNGRNKIQR